MKRKNVLFIVLTVVFAVFSYIYIDRGINVRTKKEIFYKVDSDVFYTVNLFDNDIFNEKSLKMGGTYISSIVSDIDFTVNYEKRVKEDISGYYVYGVVGKIVAYKENENDVVWEDEYVLLGNRTNLLNENNIKNIVINDTFNFDYSYYKKKFDKFVNNYGVDLSGYMELSFNVKETIGLKEIKDDVVSNSVIKVIIPLSSDMFKINVITDNNVSSYNDFSTKERVNYLFLVFGSLCFSIMVANLFLVVDGGIKIYKNMHKYDNELKKITNKYGNILVEVKRFYNKRKYNLIYVDSFNELMDVYNKIKCPITYREVKKNMETIFLITDGDNAWIYRMVNENRIEK